MLNVTSAALFFLVTFLSRFLIELIEKRAQNKVTSDLLKCAKALYFSKMFNEVKSSSAYWKLAKDATSSRVRKSIGPPRKCDDSLVLTYKEKAGLLISVRILQPNYQYHLGMQQQVHIDQTWVILHCRYYLILRTLLREYGARSKN